ncbi:hypothetical protein HOM98_00070 [Candidatus Peregrinibacteria bacterium]|nr:hypothetical protein [Candidatus Peregrinibacteria bacterium]MBT7483979.1 hypothetical protein [Candidatus Peregrinibacteria bacterium]
MSKSTSVLLSIILTALVVGGASYFWAKGEISSLREEMESMQETEEATEATEATEAMAEDVEEAIAEEDRSYDDMWLSFGDLSFYLPKGWSESQAMQSSEGVKFAYISVPDPEYNVQLKITMTEGTTYGENQEPLAQQYEAKVYQVACGGAYACYALVFLDDYEREIVFQIESDQEAPADLDAPWMPSTEVTRDELIQFLLSVALTAE